MNALFDFLRQKYPRAMVASARLEGTKLVVATARPGLLIGRQGAEFEKLRTAVNAFHGAELELELVEIRQPELEPVLLAYDIARRLAVETPPERGVDLPAQQALKAGAAGCRVVVTGAVSHRCEFGAIDEATAEFASEQAALEPPPEEDGSTPAARKNPPRFTVEVTLNRPPRAR